MAYNIKFVFLENPNNGFNSDFYINVPGLLVGTFSLNFVNSVSNTSTESLIGSDITNSANNLTTFLNNFKNVVQPSIATYSTVSSLVESGNTVRELSISSTNKTWRYVIEFRGNPASGTGFSLDLKKNGSVLRNIDKTFTNTGGLNNTFFCPIGSGSVFTYDNLLSNLQTYNTNASITYSLSPTINTYGLRDIYIDVIGSSTDVFTLSLYSNNTSVLYFINPVLLTEDTEMYYYIENTATDFNIQEIKCRSPYFYIKPVDIGPCGIYNLINGNPTASTFTYTDCASGSEKEFEVPAFTNLLSDCALIGSVNGLSYSLVSNCGGTYSDTIDYDKITYFIKTWEGDINTPTSLISYIKDKPKVVSSQTNIYINLSNLVKEKLEGDIDNYIISNNPTQSQNIGIKESKWVNVYGDFYLNGSDLGRTFDNNFFVIDGYTEPGEDQGLIRPFTPGWEQRVLMSNWYKRQYAQYSQARIHFKTKDLVSIDVYNGNVYPSSATMSIAVTANPDISNEYIQSILVDTTANMTYVFNYTDSSEVVWTYITDSFCKYENYDVIFKNKWGVLETLSFPMKSVKSLSIEDTEYLRGIVDYNGSFNVSRHTRKTINTFATEEWTLNTDWVEEYMNDVFRELMLSEEIWVVDRYNKIIPVNKSETQFTSKTRVNDKLIQYTMKFKLSHNTINNIL